MIAIDRVLGVQSRSGGESASTGQVKKTSGEFSQSKWWVASEEKLSDFYGCAWKRGDSSGAMLVVRLMMALVGVAMLAWAVAEAPNSYFLIYLTNWGLIAVAALPVSAVIVSISAELSVIPQGTAVPPWYVGMYWVLYNIGVTMALTITVLYWALLFSPDICERNDRLCWLEMLTHTANSVVVLVELLAARTPVRILHIYMPLFVGVGYIVFTWIYYIVEGTDTDGGSNIYDILDWDHPCRTWLVMLGALVVMALLYVLVWALALFRDWLTVSLIRTTSYTLPFLP